MSEIRPIKFDTILTLTSLCPLQPDKITSYTLTQNEHVLMKVFAFDKERELKTHTSMGDAYIQILSGSAIVHIHDKVCILHKGEVIAIKAGVPHSLYAIEKFQMLLTVIFHTEKGEQ